MRGSWLRYSLVLVVAAVPLTVPPDSDGGDEPPPADIENDEGGPVTITGSVEYSDPLFVEGVAEPLIILEDQAGFVDRDRGFVMPQESQVIGQITSDFFTSPFTYSVSLPVEPEASLRDVDNDGGTDDGVMIYAVAYWTNTWGDPFLEVRDLFGGGWSTTYASTLVDPDPSAEGEIIGGTFLLHAPDDQQGFPSGFGDDGLLFTEDDPIVTIPAGYTVVTLDSETFTFDRSREIEVDLIESEQSAAEDFSAMTYTEAFDAMIELFRTKYAFTEYKKLDWDAISAEFRPRFEEAEDNSDPIAYSLALRDFTWEIPDGHVGGAFPSLDPMFQAETTGGLGLAMRELDDGRIIANFVGEEGPAQEAAIELRAEILEINGRPVADVVLDTVPWSSPFSTGHVRRLQQLRYALRFPVGEEVELSFQNPGDAEPTTATLTSVEDPESFAFSSFNVGLTGVELPVEFEILDSGYGYVKIYSFFDNSLLTIQLWERMIGTLNEAGVPGLIIDMRQNGGGNGFLADQMAAYFFDEELTLGNTGFYDEGLGEFYFDPRQEGRYYLPPEPLRYDGPVSVVTGPNCASACEFFTYDMTLQDRATVVGQYPTQGLGGSIEVFLMPEGEALQFTTGRAVDGEGEIHIEGIGVPPDVDVPVDEETLFSEGDPVLDAAVVVLDEATAIEIVDGGDLDVGESIAALLVPRTRVQFTLEASAGDTISIFAGEDTGQFDTYLRLYDSEENLLAENDDEGPNNVNSAIQDFVVPEDMTLVIEVATFEDTGEGDFLLEVTEGGTPSSEPPSSEPSASTEPSSSEPEATETATTESPPVTTGG